MALTLTKTFDALAEGTAVASGSDNCVFVVSSGGAPTATAAAAIHGARGIHVAPATGSSGWGYALPNTAASTGSVYLRIHTLATAATGVVKCAPAGSGFTSLGGLFFTGASQHLKVQTNSGALVAQSTRVFAAGDLVRADWQLTWDGANLAMTVRLFYGANLEGATPDETLAGAAWAEATTPGWLVFGSSAPGYDLDLDTIRLYDNTSAWPDAYAPPAPPSGATVGTWDGSTEGTGTVFVWDGSTETPAASIEVV